MGAMSAQDTVVIGTIFRSARVIDHAFHLCLRHEAILTLPARYSQELKSRRCVFPAIVRSKTIGYR